MLNSMARKSNSEKFHFYFPFSFFAILFVCFYVFKILKAVKERCILVLGRTSLKYGKNKKCKGGNAPNV